MINLFEGCDGILTFHYNPNLNPGDLLPSEITDSNGTTFITHKGFLSIVEATDYTSQNWTSREEWRVGYVTHRAITMFGPVSGTSPNIESRDEFSPTWPFTPDEAELMEGWYAYLKDRGENDSFIARSCLSDIPSDWKACWDWFMKEGSK